LFKKYNIPHVIVKNSYLLVLAAWLVTLSFLINNYWSSNSNLPSVQKKMTEYVQQSERDFSTLFTDSNLQPVLKGGNINAQQQKMLLSKKYDLFIYKTDTSASLALKYWNTQEVLPDSIIIHSPLKAGFAHLPNGFYVWNKWDSAGIFSIALIPVKWNYIVTNEYLKNDFVNSPAAGQQFNIFPGASLQGNVQSIHNVPLFYLVEKKAAVIVKDPIVSVWLKILAAILVLLFLHFCATYLAANKKLHHAIVFLLTSILILRALSYVFPLPLNFRQLELFDPTIYGSNVILRSLGDLLINAVLFVWVIIFIRMLFQEKKISLPITHPNLKWLFLFLGTILFLGATFGSVNIIRSLVADSQISFDVINFFSLNIYSVVGFVVLCCVAVGYYFLCQWIMYLLKPLFSAPFIELYLSTTILGLLFLSFNIGSLREGMELVSLGWLLLFLFLLNSSYRKINSLRIISNSKLLFWIFFFSVSMTFVINIENNLKELRNRKHYAEVLATKTDPASELMLNSMLTDFRLDFLSGNFSRLKNKQANKFFKDSLINNNVTGYTNRYDTRIFSFDENENPLFNEGNASYNQLNTILNTQAKATGISGLYYYDESYDRFSYISKKVIHDFSGNFLGTIIILVTPKRIKNALLYPELFSRGINTSLENSSIYSFAVYSKKRLINSHNDYPFSTVMPSINFHGGEYLLLQDKKYNELWYTAGAEKYIVIIKENRRSLETITLFSYLFCAFLLLTALFWMITVFIRSRLNPQMLRSYWQLSIRNQIHGIIIFISTVSFMVIAVATILFFISRYESNNQEKLSRAIQIMKNQVAASLSEGWQLNDSMLVLDKSAAQEAEKNIINIAEIHGVNVNIYDLKGDLKLASLPLPYVKGIVSTKMEPTAYFHLYNNKEVQYFQKEHIGSLSFVSSYVPVLDAWGNPSAYLNIPYYTSQSKLQQEIANVLETIINLNAFIFLIAGIVALFITNRITGSFSVISEKMKKINLGKINEAIQWNRNDEIGSLVIEYNKMLSKLDESAAALAKTEREGAWREMAKQVAHEIKNPLTPMKLSMQFLQRSIENNAPDVKALTANVANTMVEQIDHLSNIASEFSQFANIENANKETLDINELLHSIKQLHEGNEQISIHWSLMEEPILIYADKTHVNRLFTNLIQNALQSVTPDKMPVITVKESLREGYVLTSIKDNGDGIPEKIQPKIFTPNFTTKTSGTGLGLAICKRIVEQMNGQIWFETSPQEGTTFFVLLPMGSD
jgi:signal transduction histidine kinase